MLTTPQHHADMLLRQWQALHSLPPEERIERLFLDFFAPPPPSDLEYEITLRQITETMMEAA